MKSLKKIITYSDSSINRVLMIFHLQLMYFPPSKNLKENIADFLTKIRPESQVKELIRVGSNHDGGYLVPNDLEDIKYCYSPGVQLLAILKTN